MTPRFRRLTAWIRRMTPWIRTMFDLFVGCAAAGADFAVPGVASGLRVVGVLLMGCLGLDCLLAFVFFTCCIYSIWSVCRCLCLCLPRAIVTAVSAIRRTLCPLHLCIRMLCAVHVYVHTPRTAYPRSRPSYVCCTSGCVPTPCVRCAHAVGTLQCTLRSPRGDLFVACVFCVTGVVGVFTLPTRVTQPSFFPDDVEQLSRGGSSGPWIDRERGRMSPTGRPVVWP
jgi:hypothetical protein